MANSKTSVEIELLKRLINRYRSRMKGFASFPLSNGESLRLILLAVVEDLENELQRLVAKELLLQTKARSTNSGPGPELTLALVVKRSDPPQDE